VDTESRAEVNQLYVRVSELNEGKSKLIVHSAFALNHAVSVSQQSPAACRALKSCSKTIARVQQLPATAKTRLPQRVQIHPVEAAVAVSGAN
jgi:hypothetical protein